MMWESMKDSLKTDLSTDMGNLVGLMGLTMKESIEMTRNTEMGSCMTKRTNLSEKESGNTITSQTEHKLSELIVYIIFNVQYRYQCITRAN